MPLTLEQQATNHATQTHMHRVAELLHKIAKDLLDRADRHDVSKLASPEVEAFTEFTPKLAECTYDSEEYRACLTAMKPALDHHYANNRHHPEHFPDGVMDMNLVDLLEMMCDWKAASERQHDGNLRKSVERNADRFGLLPQLQTLLHNTADLLFQP